MPVVNWPEVHWLGAEANAVAVAALPVVLLVIDSGRSAVTKVRKEGLPLDPLGAARKLFAVWLPKPAPVKGPHEGSEPFEVRKVLLLPMAKRELEEEWK